MCFFPARNEVKWGKSTMCTLLFYPCCLCHSDGWCHTLITIFLPCLSITVPLFIAVSHQRQAQIIHFITKIEEKERELKTDTKCHALMKTWFALWTPKMAHRRCFTTKESGFILKAFQKLSDCVQCSLSAFSPVICLYSRVSRLLSVYLLSSDNMDCCA